MCWAESSPSNFSSFSILQTLENLFSTLVPTHLWELQVLSSPFHLFFRLSTLNLFILRKHNNRELYVPGIVVSKHWWCSGKIKQKRTLVSWSLFFLSWWQPLCLSIIQYFEWVVGVSDPDRCYKKRNSNGMGSNGGEAEEALFRGRC